MGFLSFLILGFVTVYGCVLVVADLRSKERGVERGESHTERERRERGRKSLTGGLTVLGTKLGLWTNLVSFKMS